MENFLLVASGLDVLPLLYSVSNQSHLWDQHPVRTTFPGSPHAQVSDVLLRFQEPTKTKNVQKANADHETVPYPAWWALPEARPLVFGLMARVQAARLGRVILTKLRPGCKIPPHVDSAPHSTYYTRFHVTLCTPQHCWFRIEDEILTMQPGECWMVRNNLEHEVQNEGDSERWALIIDLHNDVMA